MNPANIKIDVSKHSDPEQLGTKLSPAIQLQSLPGSSVRVTSLAPSLSSVRYILA